MTEVKPAQIWADNDPRSAGRTLRVERIEGSQAVCVILTNITPLEADLRRGVLVTDRRGETTRISLARFKPTSSGYRLIRDTQYGVRWPTGSVFSFSSRDEAEWELAHGGPAWTSTTPGVLVVHEYEPGHFQLHGVARGGGLTP